MHGKSVIGYHLAIVTISTNQCFSMSKGQNFFAFSSDVEMMENLPLAILSTLSLLTLLFTLSNPKPSNLKP
jgi:hypothetical protein